MGVCVCVCVCVGVGVCVSVCTVHIRVPKCTLQNTNGSLWQGCLFPTPFKGERGGNFRGVKSD